MQIRKQLFLELLKSAYMQRWNDKLRPLELVELDKQAHKMIIAYFLGKFHEQEPGFSWRVIIEGGLFEFLQRIVVTDLKPQVFEKIKNDRDKYAALNQWVYTSLESTLAPLGKDFQQSFRDYFQPLEPDLNRRILNAAHFFATQWEFDIIARANPTDYELDDIKRDLQNKQVLHNQLASMRILSDHVRFQKFINLCGQLRFQIRWSRIHRVPRTSVLGHMLFVAIISYLFSRSVDAPDRQAANNYFTGLFHDLPEALTRDIISPVKRSVPGLDHMIKAYEHEEMQKVYQLLPDDPRWQKELALFTEHEFEDVSENGEILRDGQLVQAADKFAAFIEAYEAIRNGSPSQELKDALLGIRQGFGENKSRAGVDFKSLYADFEPLFPVAP
ncbi:MAG: HD domain-containing protein [Candidatus Firestonebacteria bacterium]|nr:HD domain-containing protein [Candidatus Firestonebacteria bacterium]